MDEFAGFKQVGKVNDEFADFKQVGKVAPEPDPRDHPAYGMNPLEKLVVGAGAATDRAIRGITGLVGKVTGDLDPATEAQGAEDAALYQKYHPGGWATAGEVGADIGMGAIPVAKGGQVLSKTLSRLGRAAPLVADVAANAGYAAATAPEDRGSAAAWGGGGAAAGRGLARVATGLVTPTREAQHLLDKGVRLTPGQAAGKDSFANSIEQRLSSNAIASYPINAARSRALEDANQEVAQSVVSHVDKSMKLGRPPSEAIGQVRDTISGVYDDVLPRLNIPRDHLVSLTDQISTFVPEDAHLVGERQAKKLTDYLERRVLNGIPADTVATGEFLKQVDAELGSYARSLSKSTNAEERVASPMWYDAQQKWREYVIQEAAQGSEDYVKLGQANTAYKQLLAVEKALKASGGERVNPRALAKSLESSGINRGDLYDTSRAMSATLPGTIPDSGTAGRLLANALPGALLGGGALGQYYGVDPYGLATGALAAGALGSRTGGKVMMGNTAPQKYLLEALRMGGNLTPAQVKERAARLAAQAGRAMGQ